MNRRQVIKQQKWFCENCDERGTVDYPQHAGMYEVLNLIEDDHLLKSPQCPVPVTGLRVVNEDFVPIASATPTHERHGG